MAAAILLLVDDKQRQIDGAIEDEMLDELGGKPIRQKNTADRIAALEQRKAWIERELRVIMDAICDDEVYPEKELRAFRDHLSRTNNELAGLRLQQTGRN